MTPTAVSLIRRARRAGVLLYVQDDTLYVFPGRRVSPALRDELAHHNHDVREVLRCVAYESDPPAYYDPDNIPPPRRRRPPLANG